MRGRDIMKIKIYSNVSLSYEMAQLLIILYREFLVILDP